MPGPPKSAISRRSYIAGASITPGPSDPPNLAEFTFATKAEREAGDKILEDLISTGVRLARADGYYIEIAARSYVAMQAARMPREKQRATKMFLEVLDKLGVTARDRQRTNAQPRKVNPIAQMRVVNG